MDTKTTPDGVPDPPDVLGALADLVARAGQGDEDALPALREALRAPELWRHAAGVAAAARATWAAHLAAEGLADAVPKGAAGEMPIASSGGLEGMLDEYVAVCRLLAAYTKHRAAQLTASPGVNTGLNRRAASARRQLRLALKRLELVRQLLHARGE